MRAEIRHISSFCAEALAKAWAWSRSWFDASTSLSITANGLWRRLATAGAPLALALLAAWAPAQAVAQTDEDFMVAREAFRTGNRAKLDAVAPRLRDHPLNEYVLYWQMRQRLEEADAEDIRALLVRLADGPLGDRLRNDWLASLGRRGSWSQFHAEHHGLRHEDADVACYALRRRAALGEAEALRAARLLWLAPRAAPESCTPVIESAINANIITQADVWSRIRLALEQAQASFAKRVSAHLTNKEGFEPKPLDAASSNPRTYLERNGAALKTRGGREIAIFALARMARNAPQEALRHWQAMQPSFGSEDRRYVWGRLAYFGAMYHDPDALGWFAQAGPLNDSQLAWRSRAALRAQQWNVLAQTIDAMSETARAEPEWRYWKARTLTLQGRTAEANALLVPLSAEHHFYGLLAAEEMGDAIGAPSEPYRPSEAEIKEFASLPSIRRAIVLYRLGLRIEGNREWFWAIATLDDRELLAGAEFARRNELWDRAINTAERTKTVHDFTLRYLAPYRDRFRSHAREYGLDEAWVLGVARQESRFIADARSSAGATGLMQLMPATARWVAGKLGLQGFRQAVVTDLDINISLGTYYLKHVLETLDNQPVLASAGYNAGPGRARAWRSHEQMESAIYTETIPFDETRDYVKKVMANATFYARQLGLGLTSLKDRIGTIPARGLDGR